MHKCLSILLCILLCCLPFTFAETVSTSNSNNGYSIDVLTSVFSLLDNDSIDAFFIDNADTLVSLIGQDASNLADDNNWIVTDDGYFYPLRGNGKPLISLICDEKSIVSYIGIARSFSSASDAAQAAGLFFTTLELSDHDNIFYFSDSACKEIIDFPNVYLQLYKSSPDYVFALLQKDHYILKAIYNPDLPTSFVVVLMPKS